MRPKTLEKRLKDAAFMAAMPLPTTPEGDLFVSFEQLSVHGITYTRVHLRRLMRAGRFPAPVQLSANRVAWRLSDLARWKASRPTAPLSVDAATLW